MTDSGMHPMTERIQDVLRAARALHRMRHNYPSVPAADLDEAMHALDLAVRALMEAEATARVQANPLSKLGG